jgi:hypothetical protein
VTQQQRDALDPKALEVSDAQLAAVNLHPHDWHGDWNFTITPSQTES